MNVGINTQLDESTIRYYDLFYDVLRTPNFDDHLRLLRPQHGIQIIGSKKNQRCRFCQKNEPEVHFTKIAHVFPESIGNNALASNYECDTCNQFFGNTTENDYANFFNLYHSIMQIDGKSGVPKCKFKVPCKARTDECAKYCVEISLDGNKPQIRRCKEVENKYIRFSNNSITISKPVGKCCPIAVFKAIVKMAITVMPVEELSGFTNTIQWILEPEHRNFYSDSKLLVRYKMIPGFNVTKYPHFCLFRRKKTVWNKPYMLFNLTYGCFSLFIEIPSFSNKNAHGDFEIMPFPPLPFYTNAEGIWDLSKIDSPKDMLHSIMLNFDTYQDCTDRLKQKSIL